MEKVRDARDTLITANMRLVRHVAKQIVSNNRRLATLTFDDLVQEGSLGLSRAIDKYNISTQSSTTRFSTYAYYWIRASILRALAEKNEYIRIPEHVSQTVSKMSRAVEALGWEGGMENVVRNWAWREVKEAKLLAETIGENVDKVDRVMEVEKRRRNGMVVLMGQQAEQQSWMTLDNNSNSSSEDRKEDLKQVLHDHLKPKEAQALSLRYGLIETQRDYEAEAEDDLFGPKGILSSAEETLVSAKRRRPKTSIAQLPTRGKWGEAMSFKEIGKAMAISAEYGRNLCSNGLHKLRAAADEGDRKSVV